MNALQNVQRTPADRPLRWDPLIVIWNFSFAFMIGLIAEGITHWFHWVPFLAFGTIVMCYANTSSYWLSEDSGTWDEEGRRPWRRLLCHRPCVTAVAVSSGIGALLGTTLPYVIEPSGSWDVFGRPLLVGVWLAGVAIFLRPALESRDDL